MDTFALQYQENFVPWVILTIFAVLMIMIFAGSIYSFFHAIFILIFSKGDAKEKDKAIGIVRYMILGIIFSVILLYIFPAIFQWSKVQGYEYYNANNIFTIASEIVRELMNIGDIVQNGYKGSSVFLKSTPENNSEMVEQLDTSL